MSVRFSVIIPAYNEEATLEAAIHETEAAMRAIGETFEIIVVDDGSESRISHHACLSGRQASRNVRTIRHETNLGKGAAVRTGMLATQGEWALFLDADLATHPSTFASFLPFLDNNDIVFGSRRVSGAVIADPQPWYRDWSGQLFNVLVRAFTHLQYRDTQCGFKAFRLSVCRPLFETMETTGWVFDVELLVRARSCGLRLTEVPVVWRQGPVSRVRFGHWFQIMRDLWRLRAAG